MALNKYVVLRASWLWAIGRTKQNDKIAETKGAQRRAQVDTIWIKFGIRVLEIPGVIKCAKLPTRSVKILVNI